MSYLYTSLRLLLSPTGQTGWVTFDHTNVDDAMCEGAQLILSLEGDARPSYMRIEGNWAPTPYLKVHEHMRQLQVRYPWAGPLLLQEDLRALMGLSPATPENCPDTPVDPKLTGEASDGSSWRRDFGQDKL